jgi:hypothetical protein
LITEELLFVVIGFENHHHYEQELSLVIRKPGIRRESSNTLHENARAARKREKSRLEVLDRKSRTIRVKFSPKTSGSSESTSPPAEPAHVPHRGTLKR